MIICHNYFVLSLIALLVIGISSGKPQRRGDYHVSLQRHYEHLCSGALISYRHVLTAANLLVGHGGRHYKKGLTIVTDLESGGGQTHTAHFVQVHPHFSKGEGWNRPRNDIAVITLKPSLSASSMALPIALPLSNNIDSTKFAHFAGMGYTFTGLGSSIAKQFQVHIGNQKYCESQYRTDHFQLCTLNKKGQGTCWGDEGGPLEYESTVVGILSYRIGKCNDGQPEVYTRVAYHRKFIEDAMYNH